MRLIEILPVDVREWGTELKNAGVSPTVIRSCFVQHLSEIFTAAFNYQLTAPHPCRGVKTPPVPRRFAIVNPAQFDEIYEHLPNEAARLPVETDSETGLRWADDTALTVLSTIRKSGR